MSNSITMITTTTTMWAEGPHVSSASWQTHESSRAPLYEQPPTLDPSTHDYEEDEALDGDEDRQSEEGSEGEPGHHDMEFWLQRCSICFDARLDFCLEYCRDQFCRSCFQRYVKEVVGNSWGLDVTKIKCPVCQDVIAVSEWTKYVDQSTLAQYHQFNQPYRSFSRFCNECEHELVVSTVNQAAIGLPASSFLPLFDKVLVDLKALLTRAGLNLDEPIATLSPSPVPTVSQNQPPPKASKQRRGNFSRDEAARKIVQKFTDDYQSYCGLNQGTQQSLPSRAQSYLSSLASRALGATFTPSTFPLSANSAPSKPLQPLQTDSSSSASEVQALGIAHQIVGTPMQRKQYCSRMGGVLEIYRPLITSLLELFQLWQKEYDDEASRPRYEGYHGSSGFHNGDQYGHHNKCIRHGEKGLNIHHKTPAVPQDYTSRSAEGCNTSGEQASSGNQTLTRAA
ncbi:hypothetical protein BGX31_010972 [Mortierella sp. GBA43]|nr:hypothetical protein BGX31_010972 [Mortierella sp. GBA43]